MAVHRDEFGNLDRVDFENHLKARTRKEGYVDIIMYTPDTNIQISSVTSNDKLSICNLDAIIDLDKYNSGTVATLEENLWLLDGRFIVYQGTPIDGYVSESVSNENGEFKTNPKMKVNLAHVSNIENFSVMLNPAVPSAYPKSIIVHCYNASDTEVATFTEKIEWEDTSGSHILETLPSVNFEINTNNISYLEIEFVKTRFRHRRIRVSTIMFGKTIYLDQNAVLNVDFDDKTSYVCDTLPSRTFSFDVNNYDGFYNIDNPENGYINLTRQTRIRFRNGYNVFGYEYNSDGTVKMEDEFEYTTVEQPVYDDKGNPVVDEDGNPVTHYVGVATVKRANAFPVINHELGEGTEIEWDSWKELRLMDVSANADESATFTCGSLLDVMEETYTTDIYPNDERRVAEIVNDILVYEGFDLNSVEFSTDPNGTNFGDYRINVPIPEVTCKEVLQLLAFSVGATLLIKDNGHIKFANLNISDPTTFTNSYTWHYTDFESIPAAEQLDTINNLSQISMPKYYAGLEQKGDVDNFVANNSAITTGNVYSNCKVIATATCTSVSNEITYSDAYVIGARLSDENSQSVLQAVSLGTIRLYSKRGLISLIGFSGGEEVKVEIIGYPIEIKTIQERNVTSDSLVLNTQVMQYDITVNNTSEYIKRKYLEWYKKKFKYTYNGRGEPLVNAGDYGVIQTQFSAEMPVYILRNHWTFDGTWSGDMEVIALD
jgi:hypothetical protein